MSFIIENRARIDMITLLYSSTPLDLRNLELLLSPTDPYTAATFTWEHLSQVLSRLGLRATLI